MTDKNSSAPDEQFDCASKDTTRQCQSATDKNKQKPDHLKTKGEPNPAAQQEEDEETD